MTFDDKPRIARVTALLAANAYALIRVMQFVEEDPGLPREAALIVLLPVIGLGLSYALLERPQHTIKSEFWAGAPVAALVVVWMLREFFTQGRAPWIS